MFVTMSISMMIGNFCKSGGIVAEFDEQGVSASHSNQRFLKLVYISIVRSFVSISNLHHSRTRIPNPVPPPVSEMSPIVLIPKVHLSIKPIPGFRLWLTLKP